MTYHFTKMPMRLMDKDVRYSHGVPVWTYKYMPVEEVRAWIWEHGVKYVLRSHREKSDPDGWRMYYTIGFDDPNRALEFKMRWG
ncbi:MAG: hypothetical protein EOP83_30815 [Verrucomicrobiaceae bacterium]|nr:MAG: hypothetical protein EOP83_30815 [Verrucomicrobiaceae bacterium]